MMTVSAVARLMPKPPALVESKKQNWQAPGAGNREGGERMCEREINRNTCRTVCKRITQTCFTKVCSRQFIKDCTDIITLKRGSILNLMWL